LIVSKNEYWEHEAAKRDKAEQMAVRYAKVTGITASGDPVIRFVGDKEPSQKTYVRLKSYVPEAGDMVMLIGEVIVGGWKVVN